MEEDLLGTFSYTRKPYLNGSGSLAWGGMSPHWSFIFILFYFHIGVSYHSINTIGPLGSPGPVGSISRLLL